MTVPNVGELSETCNAPPLASTLLPVGLLGQHVDNFKRAARHLFEFTNEARISNYDNVRFSSD